MGGDWRAAPPDLASIDERLIRLGAQLDSLERAPTNLPSPPVRSRGEIVANVRALERAELLQKYTPAHPVVREIDLRLRLLRLHLGFLGQADQVPL